MLLARAWTTDLEAQPLYVSGTIPEQNALPAYYGCWDGRTFVSVGMGVYILTPSLDNDDGISIVDVTDPEHPACCFFRGPGSGLLDACGYLRRYYTDKAIESSDGSGE